jgi:phosphatidate cytidylyltransferase
MSEKKSDDQPEKKPLGNLSVRLLTSAVAVPILLYLLFLAPTWGFAALVCAACLVAASELFAIIMPGKPLHQAVGVGSTLAVFAATVGASHLRIPEILTGSVIAVVILAILAGLLRPGQPAQGAGRTAWLMAGPLYLGVLLAALLLLFLRENGARWMVLVMTISWFGDTAAYFSGRALGRNKLYELISPKKTVEGAVGGLLGSALAALLASFWYLPSLPPGQGVALGVVAGALGQLGDLGVSLIKRGAGVKDSGFLVPGHGGILDRIDALLLVAAAVWIYLTLFQV